MDNTSIKPSFQFDLIYDLAMSYRNLGQNKAAQERLLQVLRAYPGYTPARQSRRALYSRKQFRRSEEPDRSACRPDAKRAGNSEASPLAVAGIR